MEANTIFGWEDNLTNFTAAVFYTDERISTVHREYISQFHKEINKNREKLRNKIRFLFQ